MDGPLTALEARGALDFLSLTNRRFGGNAVILRRLEAFSRRWDPSRPVTLLDAGCGAGDASLAAVRWARRRGFRLRVTAADLSPKIAAVARERARAFPEIEVVAADVFSLSGPFDYVAASLFLHHVPPPRVPAALRAFDRLARRGVIVSDLRRDRAGYAAVSALSFLAGNAVVRHDGPLSVRRAFRPDELERHARAAGLSYLRAAAEPWFRVSLSGEKV